MAVKYSKWSYNILTFSIPRPSKIYPNWDLWFEKKPPGNPALVSKIRLAFLAFFVKVFFPIEFTEKNLSAQELENVIRGNT
jgi:hypothetical protein